MNWRLIFLDKKKKQKGNLISLEGKPLIFTTQEDAAKYIDQAYRFKLYAKLKRKKPTFQSYLLPWCFITVESINNDSQESNQKATTKGQTEIATK